MKTQYKFLKLLILRQYDCQADFAQALGLSRPMVSLVLHGRRELGTEEAQRWSKLLKCKRKELVPVMKRKTRKLLRRPLL